MAGEMTPEQWGMIKGALDKVSTLCEKTIPDMAIEIAVINRDIQGNGSKGLKTVVQELACEVKELRDTTIPDLKKYIDKKKPRYSWPQIVVMVSMLAAGTTFLWSEIIRIDSKIDSHVSASIKP